MLGRFTPAPASLERKIIDGKLIYRIQQGPVFITVEEDVGRTIARDILGDEQRDQEPK
jgi:hypothetical protein